ncbi:hypothetical protein P4283_29445 [Bacillus thuringiensis]|nr:hypothetical protein [Bacillus thuringiensis]
MQNFSNINYPQNSQWFQNEIQQMRLLVDQLSQAEQINSQRLNQLHQKCNHLAETYLHQEPSLRHTPISNIHPAGNWPTPNMQKFGHYNS